MEPVVICGNCGARLRLKAGLLKVLKVVKCSKCGQPVPITPEMAQTAETPEAVAPTVLQSAAPKSAPNVAPPPLPPPTILDSPATLPPTVADRPSSLSRVFSCSGCGKKIALNKMIEGKKVKCKACGAITVAKEDSAPMAATVVAPTPAPATPVSPPQAASKPVPAATPIIAVSAPTPTPAPTSPQAPAPAPAPVPTPVPAGPSPETLKIRELEAQIGQLQEQIKQRELLWKQEVVQRDSAIASLKREMAAYYISEQEALHKRLADLQNRSARLS